MKYFFTISVLFLLGFSEYAKPKISSLPNFYAQRNNDTLDTLERLCKLLSGKWTEAYNLSDFSQKPDTISSYEGVDRRTRRKYACYKILTDSGFVLIELGYKTKKVLKIERKPFLQILELFFLNAEFGSWQNIHNYDTIYGGGSRPTCQPIPKLIKRGNDFFIYLVGMGGEWELRINYVSENKLILEGAYGKTVYRRFIEKE